MVKNLPANAGDSEDLGSVPGLVRSTGEGNGNTVHYSCLNKNPTDRRAWWAIVYRVVKSRTRLTNRACTKNLNIVVVFFKFFILLAFLDFPGDSDDKESA